MKLIKRLFSGILAGTVALTMMSGGVSAAQAGVSVDEAVYVNLDYYGKTEKVNVVKGCSMNGNLSFTDYGSYEKVTNMSNEVQPSISSNSVSWKLSGNADRFFYECTPKAGSVVLPWDFDISYKLNGVPVNADKLAGVSGLVEINIKAVPNKKAGEYLKNNMILSVESIFDMADTTSVEAPGAQLQSAGNYKAVIFAALPGEETDFTMRIGTKSFESSGIMITMMPGTLEQLKKIKDFKEAKDTVGDSGDALYAGLNEILDSIQNTSDGLNQIKSGLSSLQSARGKVSSSKEGVYTDADKALEDITNITKQISVLIPHLQNGQKLVRDVNSDVNAMVDTLGSIKTYTNSFSKSISKIQSSTDELYKNLSTVKGYKSDTKELLNKINDTIDISENDKKAMDTAMMLMNTRLSALEKDLAALDTAMKAMPAQLDAASAYYKDTTAAILNGELKGIIASIEPTLVDLSYTTAATNMLIKELGEMSGKAGALVDTAQEACALGSKYVDSIDAGIGTAQSLIKQLDEIGDTTKSFSDKSNELLDKITALNATMNKYQSGTDTALQDTEKLFDRLNTGLTDTKILLSSVEDTLKAGGGDFDEGTRQSLNGLIDLLQDSMSGIKATSTVKNAGDKIKSTVDDKLDEVEDDSNLLKMDAEAAPISFTSARNPSPQTLQIIMRTHEISIDDSKSIRDMETAKDKTGFAGRIANVFEELWNKITSLFA
ncbi:hypothetical protein LY28_00975 [Ruminiclostridium sufflavum DSM 19573]|uniref:X-X-X-Leu-X-X-Gly heptad repeat protein n=1 Tax=Ruminiclostridium sufflavum DSM 19573 TaxID=1121337 RepID=A0A318XMR8_9FIRM|nr:hypothetical protein [Ruminiclostridium sufflavum]PYG89152.1 hypothetical protein LY28_00975 [Ruminiclostridium sufflavum DSM 19573]